MNKFNDRTMDALTEESLLLIALLLEGHLSIEGIPAPTIDEDPHVAHRIWFGEICYN